jgi:hypothetical protein
MSCNVHFVTRHGRRVEVETIEPKAPPPRRRRAFEAKYIKLPRHWITALLNTRSANTYRLATLILWEAFKREHVGGEIVLSAQVTRGMPRSTRIRAAEELVELGLIQVERDGYRALRVIRVSY